METYTYDEFIEKLSELGFNIEIISTRDRNISFYLQMNNIRVNSSCYPIFGRYCGGAYNTCGFSTQTEFNTTDIENAIKFCSQLMLDEIKSISRIPNYHTCKDYLREKFGKTKIEKDAIERVLGIIKNNYNDIIRYYESNIRE